MTIQPLRPRRSRRGHDVAGRLQRRLAALKLAALLDIAVVVIAVTAIASLGDTGRAGAQPAQQTAAGYPNQSALHARLIDAPPPAATVPVRITVPRLAIDSPLDRLGLTSRGSLETPRSSDRAAWFDDGVHPGDPGPAIIAGHDGSRTGSAVFDDLHRIRRGDTVDVSDRSGTVRSFVVTDVRRYAKVPFGTAEVYGPTAQPQLRLITCSGTSDAPARSYRDNLVVFATQRGPRAG